MKNRTTVFKKAVLIVTATVILLSFLTGSYSTNAYARQLTYAEKKAWVLKNVPSMQNDFTKLFPAEDIMYAPLDNVKKWVDKSSSYQEEESVWSTFSEFSLYDTSDKISYRFSNRVATNNVNGGNNETFWDAFAEGLINGVAVDLVPADYYYLVTDGTKQNAVTRLYYIYRNAEWSYTEYINSVTYKNGVVSRKDKNGNVFGVTYTGLISEPDYEELYYYYTGVTKTVPKCVGTVEILDNSTEDIVSYLFVISPY